ncbi:MAG TPA: diheme cytochrome c [Mariprofundaceae bacterium]|nr:diheme cytochrome c [Mariprofundaceae bacterium]
MNGKKIFGSLLMAGCLTVAISGIAYSEDDDERGERGAYARTSDVPPVTNKQYATECGSCHFAYQPGWLPERSWRKLMGSLNDHFGENAELSDATREQLTNYLVGHAADVLPNRMSRRILSALKADEAPLRISELGFMRREHREIPRRMVQDNPKVGSLSSCQACHTQAAGGFFNEGGINIPGYGRYED